MVRINKNDLDKAKFFFHDGNVYEGSTKQGVMEGEGKFFYSNGDTYIGQFLDDEISGKGTYFFRRNGRIYDGTFENNEIKIINYWFEPSEYLISEEYTHKDSTCPKGRKMDFCGFMESGEFKKDQIHGRATVTDLEGNEREAEYEDGERVRWIN